MGKTIKCSYCKQHMSIKSKVCPNCGKRTKNNRNGWILVGIICIGWILVFAIAGNDNESKETINSSESQSKDVAKKEVKATDVYYLDLYNNFDKYKDKQVKFSGKVTYIYGNTVNMDEKMSGLTDMITIDVNDSKSTKDIKEGDYVTVTGVATDKILGYLYIKEGEILSSGNNSKKDLASAEKKYNKLLAEEEKEKKAKEEKEQHEKEKQVRQEMSKFKKTCKQYEYKDLARNPESYQGKKIKLKVKISQIIDGGILDDNTYYRVYTNGEDDMWWLGDEYLIMDSREDKTLKLLEDDIIEVYGEFDGTTELERALTGTTEEVLLIDMKYVSLIK